jgi:hypothetical protein
MQVHELTKYVVEVAKGSCNGGRQVLYKMPHSKENRWERRKRRSRAARHVHPCERASPRVNSPCSRWWMRMRDRKRQLGWPLAGTNQDFCASLGELRLDAVLHLHLGHRRGEWLAREEGWATTAGMWWSQRGRCRSDTECVVRNRASTPPWAVELSWCCDRGRWGWQPRPEKEKRSWNAELKRGPQHRRRSWTGGTDSANSLGRGERSGCCWGKPQTRYGHQWGGEAADWGTTRRLHKRRRGAAKVESWPPSHASGVGALRQCIDEQQKESRRRAAEWITPASIKACTVAASTKEMEKIEEWKVD